MSNMNNQMNDDELWHILTTAGQHNDARVVVARITSATADVAAATTHDGASIIIPATEFPSAQPLRVGQMIAGHLTGTRTANSDILTCSRPELVPDLLDGVVPELRDGTVRIMGLARVLGVRTKISVAATEPDLDPVSIVVGKRANRVAAVAELLGGERIDVVGWAPDSHDWLRRALAPAEVGNISTVDGTTYVEAPAHLMSAAVGQGGLNSSLAGRIVGLRVQVVRTGGTPVVAPVFPTSS